MVIKPLSMPLPSTMGSFSILCFLKISCASVSVVPSGAVTRFSLVITSLIFLEKSVSNRKSRLVKMPTSLPFSQMGTPEIRYLPIKLSASSNVRSGVK